MASGVKLRSEGQRKPAALKRGSSSLLSSSLGIAEGRGHGEHRLNLQQVYALENMFQSNPVVQAARTVLSGQLLSGGISLKKNGNEVELTPAFKDHLSEVWLPFAQEVIDSFLKWGMVVIAYEDHDDELRRAALLAKRRRPAAKPAKAAKAVEIPEVPVVVPTVPALGTYEVAFMMGGRSGYKREYKVYANDPSAGSRADEEARVIVRQHPDQVGNINSPLSSVFDLGSFVGAITELALVAESSRARPRVVTQMTKKDSTAMDPGNLFFDAESRAVQAGADADESAAQAKALSLQQNMCAMINRLQTRQFGPDHDGTSFGGVGAPKSGKSTYGPPEVAPSLFHLPKGQEIAPHTSNPESRGDLEALTRLAQENFSAAFGLPPDLIFSGRFAGKSTSQLSLLNTTVSQLAKSVNSVLTLCYRDIYSEGNGEDVGQLQLLTSPLSATDEVLNLFNGGLVPVEIAMPSVLHAIGASKADIDAALEKALQKEEEMKTDDNSSKSYATKDNALNLESKELDIQQKKKQMKEGANADASGSASRAQDAD